MMSLSLVHWLCSKMTSSIPSVRLGEFNFGSNSRPPSLLQNSSINFPIWIIDRITIYNVVGIFQHACREVCMWMYYLTTNNVWKISNFLRVKRFVLKNTLPPLDFGIPHVSSKSATKIRHLFIGLLARADF